MSPTPAKISGALPEPSNVTELPDGTAVVLDISANQVLTLSESAAFLLRQLQSGNDSVKGLTEALHRTYEVETQQAEADVVAFLETLAQALGIDEAAS